MNKKEARQRRASRLRVKIKKMPFGKEVTRLCVHKTPSHIYAQIVDPQGKVLACASTIDKVIKKDLKNGGNVEAAKTVGKAIAERAIAKSIKKVVFDRAGFKYHGRIKALADAAREKGLDF